MFIVSRKNQESVIVDGFEGSERTVKVTVLEIHGKSVKLGFDVNTTNSAKGPGCGNGPSSSTNPYRRWEGHDFGMN